VADVTDLQSVKRIEDQNIARGKAPLGWEEYLELLFFLHAQTMTSPITLRIQHRVMYMQLTLHMM
jgi:hypothetical protein